MKFVETNYGVSKGILKFPDHYVAMAVTVDDTGVVVNEDGRKLVKAGTIIGAGSGGNVITDNTLKVTEQNGAEAEGVLMNDVDVTYGPAAGAMILHGFIDRAKLPAVPAAEAVTALAGRVIFM